MYIGNVFMKAKAASFSPLQLRMYNYRGNINYASYTYIVDRKMKSLQLGGKKFLILPISKNCLLIPFN